MREGRTAPRDIETTILGRPLTAFDYSMQGQLAPIGRRRGMAIVLGLRFSGFAAWWLWRTVYVTKLPPFTKTLRVLATWARTTVTSPRTVRAGRPVAKGNH